MESELDKIKRDADSVLIKHGFQMTLSLDEGMFKTYIWTNDLYNIKLVYDRGYYDCYIESNFEMINQFFLIQLIRNIRHDDKYYEREFNEANLYNTLTIKGYIDLFLLNKDLIERFVLKHKSDKK